MSVYVTSHVWHYSNLKGTALLLVLALADQANDEGVSWPSVATLAHKSRLSERTVQNLMPKILESGEVEVMREAGGHGRPRVYRVIAPLPPERNGAIKGAVSSPISRTKGGRKGEIEGNERVQISTERVQKIVKRANPVAPEPYSGTGEPSGEPARARGSEPALTVQPRSSVGQPCPKPIPRRTRYDQVLDLIRAAEPGLVVGGSRLKNEQPVNDSPAPVETIAAAYVDLMHGRWPDPFVQKLGSLQAVVENLGGYVYGVENGFGSLERQNGRVKPTSVPARHVVDRTGIRN